MIPHRRPAGRGSQEQAPQFTLAQPSNYNSNPTGGAAPTTPSNGGHRSAGVSAPADRSIDPLEAQLPRLNRLVSENYSFSPSASEMMLVHANNPDRLKAVSNFTITRDGFGSVHWRSPVDVTGLNLDRIITIQAGQ